MSLLKNVFYSCFLLWLRFISRSFEVQVSESIITDFRILFVFCHDAARKQQEKKIKQFNEK